MRTITNSLSFDRSEVASFRLRCIELLESHGLAAVQTAFPKVSKASLYRWRQRYLASDKRAQSLHPFSTKPHTLRQMRVDGDLLLFLRSLRQRYPYLSKYKLKPFLDLYCQDQGLPIYSVSWIGKVIKRYRYFFGSRKRIRRYHFTNEGIRRIRRCPQEKGVSLGYLQLDGVIAYYGGCKYCFLSAVEVKTRQAFVMKVNSLSGATTVGFLEAILKAVSYPIHTIQTDNGSEFQGIFTQALRRLALTHLRSYPHAPKTQAYVERFNRTLQEEWFAYEVGERDSQAGLTESLASWLNFYNTKRPHQALNYQTPRQRLEQLQLKKGVT